MRRALVISAVCACALVACGDDEFGEGTRRPPTTIAPRPTLVPVAITEVFFGDGATAAFVELRNAGSDPLALLGFELVSHLDAAVPLDVTIAAGDRLVVGGVEALLSPTSGEVAVRDEAGTVHAYAAWGGDPGARSSVLYAAAFSSGVALLSPPQVSAPYPIDPSLALVFESPRGCAAPSSGAPATGVSDCPPGVGVLTLTELYRGDSVSWVELRNDSSEALSLTGARICLTPTCAPIVRATGPLDPGAHAVVLLGVELDAVSTLAPEDVGLVAGAGSEGFACGAAFVCAAVPSRGLGVNEEIGVARPGDRGLEAPALLDYARLGADAASGLQADAIAAGLWTEGAIELAPSVTESVQLDPAATSAGPTAWVRAGVTPGSPYSP